MLLLALTIIALLLAYIAILHGALADERHRRQQAEMRELLARRELWRKRTRQREGVC